MPDNKNQVPPVLIKSGPTLLTGAPDNGGRYFSSNTNLTQYAGLDNSGNKVDFGDSQYDTPDISISDLKSGQLNEYRAQRQSALDKAGNAVPRFVGRVATSAAELGGNIYGLLKYSTELQLEPLYKTQYLQEKGTLEGYKAPSWTTIFDNEVTRGLDSMDKSIKEAFPQYESKAYQNAPWYKKLQYANFYASDLVDGAAFATGSALSGAMAGKIISPMFKLAMAGDMAIVDATMAEVKAGKITLEQGLKSITRESKKIKYADIGQKFVNMTIAGTAESGQEARGIGDDVVKSLTDQLTIDPATGQKVRDLTPEEEAHIAQMKEQAEGTGFLLNMLVTGPTNLAIQSSFFNKLKGLKNDKALLDDAIKPNLNYEKGIYSAAKQNKYSSFGKGLVKSLKNNSEEAIQEMYQTGVQKGATDYYQAKFEGKEGYDQMLKSLMVGLEGATSDEGLLSGLLGFLTPAISNTLLTRGKNIKESFGKFSEQSKQDVLYATYLNKLKSNNVFAAAYEAGAKHQVFQNQLDDAIENADDFEVKNALHNVMTNLVLTRINAGRFDDLQDDLNDFKKLNKEDFKEAFGVDLREEDRDFVASFVQDKINKVNEIKETRDDVKSVFSTLSTGNQERLTHATLAAKDSRERATKLSKLVLNIVNDNYMNTNEFNQDATLAFLNQDYNKLSIGDKVKYREALESSDILPANKTKVADMLNDIDKLKGRSDNYVKLYEELTNPEVQQKKDVEDKVAEEKADKKASENIEKEANESKANESKLTYDGSEVTPYTIKGVQQFDENGEKLFKSTKGIIDDKIPESQLDQNIVKQKSVQDLIDEQANTQQTGTIPLGTTDAIPTENEELVIQQEIKVNRILNKNEFNRFTTNGTNKKADSLINSLDFSNPEVQKSLFILVKDKPYNSPDNTLNNTHEISLVYRDSKGVDSLLGYMLNPDSKSGVNNTNTEDEQFINEQKENNRKLFNYLITSNEHNVLDLIDKGLFTLETSGGGINKFVGDAKNRPLVSDNLDIIAQDENGNPLIFDTKIQGFVGVEGNLEDLLPGTPSPSKSITDRYVVPVKQSNGKIQWIASQPATMSYEEYAPMLAALQKQSTKTLTVNKDKDNIKEKDINDEFNSSFNDDFFITIPENLIDVVRFVKLNVGVLGGLVIDIKPQGSAKSVKIKVNNEILQSIKTTEDFFEMLNANNKMRGYVFGKNSFRNKVSENSSKKAATQLQMNLNVQEPFVKNTVLLNFSESVIPVVKQEFTEKQEQNKNIKPNPVGEVEVPKLTTVKVDLKGLTINELNNVAKQLRQKAINARDAEKQGKSVIGGSQSVENDYQAVKKYISELANQPQKEGDVANTTTTLSKDDDIRAQIKALKVKLDAADNTDVMMSIMNDIDALESKLGPSKGIAFKVSDSTPEELIDLNKATSWIKNRLPHTIDVKDIDTISENIDVKGATWGAFRDGLIYLSKEAGKGTEYHEAFHAVFRTLLSDKDISRYLKLAQLERGLPTTKEVDAAREKYNLTLSHEQMSDLILEEYMADKFMDWVKNKEVKTLPGLRGVFQKIWNWLQYIISNKDSMEALFYNIEKGSFKTKQREYNRYQNASYAYMLIPAGEEKWNAVDTEKIIATTAFELMQLKRTKEYSEWPDSRLLSKIFDAKKEDSNRTNESNIALLKQLPSDKQRKLLLLLSKESKTYANPDSRDMIAHEVEKRMKIFDFDKNETEENNQATANETGDRFDLNASNIGGFGTVSKAIRQLIAFTLITEEDEFGRTITRSVDVPTVYNGIERLLANTKKEDMLAKLKNYSEYNPEVNAFYNKLKGLIVYNELTGTWENNSYYNAFTTAFDKSKVFYIFALIDPKTGKYQLGNANQRDVGKVQIDRWAANLEFSKVSKQEAINKLKKLSNSYLKASEEVKGSITDVKLKDAVKELKMAFNDLGIELSAGYIKYSILHNRKRNVNQDEYFNAFDSVQAIQSDGKVDTNLDVILSLFEKGNPYIKEEDSEDDAVTRIKNIAEGNAIFDETVGSSSFQNADGETVYDKILGSYTIKRATQYQDEKATDITSYKKFREGHPYLTEYDAKQLYELLKKNLLLNSKHKDLIFDKAFVVNLIDGIRQSSINTNSKTGETFEDKNKSKSEGKTFKEMQVRDTLLMMYGLSTYTKNKYNTDETGKKETVKFYQSYFKVLEASNTGYTVSLPEQKLWNYGLTQLAKDQLYTFFEQEVDRIARGTKEIAEIEAGNKNDIPVIEGYHNGKQRAKEFWNFKFLSTKTKESISKSINEGTELSEELKTIIKQEIADNYSKEERNDHIKQLVDLKIIEQSKDKITGKLIPDTYHNKLLPNDYVNSVGNVDLNKVSNFFFNDLINSWSFNQLIDGDWAMSRKDEIDFVKRNKGANAMQQTFGTGTSRGAIYKEPITDGIKRADAQMHETLAWRIKKLTALGKFSKKVEKVYDKIVNDDELTPEDLTLLQKNDVTLISDKDVYYDGNHYFKLSSFVLTRQYTSKKVAEGTPGAHKSIINGKSYIAYPGRKLEFDMQNEMERENIDYVMPESASKGMTKDVRELGNLKANDYQNRYWGKQVDTPSGKVQISEPTQKDGLIDSEQHESMQPIVKARQELLAQRLDILFKGAKNMLQDQLGNKEYTLKFILDKFKSTLEESGADVNLIEFFSADDTGNPKYDLNLPITINKFEQLYYAHFTKGILSVKSPGYALILKTDNGFQVERADGSLSDLQHGVEDKDGLVYSEIVLPAHFKEMYGLKPGDILNDDVLKMLGMRIPTQDKHSMMSLKVVDFLPEMYGSIVIAPKEIVLLSGADFDVDKLYIRRFDHFVDTDGVIKIFGRNGDDIKTRWNEFLIWQKANNKDIKSSKDIEQSLKRLGLPSTIEEYANEVKANGEQNLGVINNELLSAELKLYGNEHIRDIANTPATLDELTDLSDEIGIVSKSSGYNINSINGKLAAKFDNDTGKTNIGPAAVANMIFNLLAKNNIKLREEFTIEIGDEKFNEFVYKNKEGKRINHLISTILSAMTDNAKERLASVFNLTPDTLPSVLYLVSLGVPLKQVMQISTSPIMQEYTKRMSVSKAGVKTEAEEKHVSKKSTQADILKEWSDKLKDEEKNYDLTLSLSDLDKASNDDTVSNLKIFKKFIETQKQAEIFGKVNSFLQLNKGFKPSVSENNKVDLNAIDLGINLSDEQFKNSKIPFDIRPIFKTRNQISKQYELYNEVHNKIAKEFLITKSKVFDVIKNVITKNLKKGSRNSEDLLNKLDRNILSYFTVNAYKKYLIDKLGTEENAANALNSLTADNVLDGTLVAKVQELKAKDIDNMFLRYLTIEKSNDKSISFDIIASNNRVKTHPIVLEQILNGYNELYNNDETKQVAIDLFNYLVIKDGMQFKNRSISRFITPFMYRMVSDSLKEVNNFVKKDDNKDSEFIEVFGKNKIPFIEDLLKLTFEYEPHSYDYLPFHKKIDKEIMDYTDGKLKIDLFKGWEHMRTKNMSSEELADQIDKTDDNKAKLAKNKEILSESSAFDYISDDGKLKVSFPLYVKVDKGVYKLSKLDGVDLAHSIDAITDLTGDAVPTGTNAEYTKVEQFGDANYNPFASSVEDNRKVNEVIKEHKAKKAASKALKVAEAQAKANGKLEDFESSLEGYSLPTEEFTPKKSKNNPDVKEPILSTSSMDDDIDSMVSYSNVDTMSDAQIDFLTNQAENNTINKLDMSEKSDILDSDSKSDMRMDIMTGDFTKEFREELLNDLKNAKNQSDLGELIKKICNPK